MDAISSSAYNVATLALNVGAGEAVGRYNKLPPGTGALVGIVNLSLHQALQPAWTAIQINAKLNPIGTVLLLVLRLTVEAVVSNEVVNRIFYKPIETNKGIIVGASSNLAMAVCKFLFDAGLKAIRA